MANKNTTKTRRRPSKAELERKQAIQRMLISLGIALLLVIAALKLGAAGITLYNLIRLVVGSLAYVAIGALLIYLFLFMDTQERGTSVRISLYLRWLALDF